MQVETIKTVCPLCRQAGANGSVGTRLCASCRSLIQVILPANQFAPHTDRVIAVETPDLSFANLRTEAPDYLDTQPLVEETLTQAQSDEVVFTFDAEPPPQPSYEMPQYQWLSHSQPLEVPEAYIQAGANSQPLADTIPEHKLTEHKLTESPIEHKPAGQPRPVAVEHSAASVLNQESGALASASADPWADPLPAWETSRHEWPVLVEPPKPSSLSRLKLPIAILLLAASLIALFFVVILPLMKSDAPAPTQSAVKPTESAKPNAANPPTTDAQPAPSQPAPSQPAASHAASTTAEDLKGAITLQVMSSPNEAEAKAMADKLTRAGISAYVIAAEIKGRLWYRVRAGRFNTREEAQRYAEQSKARARAAGVKMETMIPVDYEKPQRD
jgi:septal ring-binding cell division protein DamX